MQHATSVCKNTANLHSLQLHVQCTRTWITHRWACYHFPFLRAFRHRYFSADGELWSVHRSLPDKKSAMRETATLAIPSISSLQIGSSCLTLPSPLTQKWHHSTNWNSWHNKTNDDCLSTVDVCTDDAKRRISNASCCNKFYNLQPNSHATEAFKTRSATKQLANRLPVHGAKQDPAQEKRTTSIQSSQEKQKIDSSFYRIIITLVRSYQWCFCRWLLTVLILHDYINDIPVPGNIGNGISAAAGLPMCWQRIIVFVYHAYEAIMWQEPLSVSVSVISGHLRLQRLVRTIDSSYNRWSLQAYFWLYVCDSNLLGQWRI